MTVFGSERRAAPARVLGFEPPPKSGSRQLSIVNKTCAEQQDIRECSILAKKRIRAHVGIKSPKDDAEDQMTIVMIAIDQSKFACRSDDRDRSSLDRKAYKTHHDTISVLEARLRLPQNADERCGDKDVGDNRAHEPYARNKIADIVERANIRSLEGFSLAIYLNKLRVIMRTEASAQANSPKLTINPVLIANAHCVSVTREMRRGM